MAPAPVEPHQFASSRLTHYLVSHVDLQGLGRVYAAPFDVELSPDNVVQPDVIVVLNDNLQVITHERIVGAPDLVGEIASPSTATHDRNRKLRAYEIAGVREYWIVDADRGEVLVLRRFRGRWSERVIRPSEVYRTRLLPGFEFACAPVFQAAEAARR